MKAKMLVHFTLLSQG